MKKIAWVALLLSLFSIYGCAADITNSSEQTSNKQVENEQDVAADRSANERAVKQEQVQANKQLQDVLIGYMNDLGFVNNRHSFYRSEYGARGLVYAELIDFDQNGQEELYVLFQTVNEADDNQELSDSGGYVHEVWQATDANEAALIHYGYIPIENCFSCGTSFSFHEMEDGRILLQEATEYYDEEDDSLAIFTDKFYELVDGEFIVNTFETNTKEPITSSFNGQVIGTDEAYLEARKPFEIDGRFIVENEYGIYSFGFDTESSAQHISNVLRSLNETNNTLAVNGKEIEPDEIQEAAQILNGLTNVDVNNPALHTEMLRFVLENHYYDWVEDGPEIESEGDLGYYPGYSEQQVMAQFERYFGIPLNMDNIDYVNFDDASSFDKITYQDGAFYNFSDGEYYPRIVRSVTKAYEIAADTFYVEMVDNEFEKFMFRGNFEEFMFWADDDYLPEDYVFKPIETWPNDMPDYAITGIQRYAVIKMVDGHPTFRYIGYQNLTDEELARY